MSCNNWLGGWGLGVLSPFTFHLSPLLARKAGIEPTLTVLETALLPLEDFRKNRRTDFSVNLGFDELRMQAFVRLAQDFRFSSSQINEQCAR